MTPLPLAGLALVDSLSVGTLTIPLALMLIWGRTQPRLMATYLGTIAVSYMALGWALAAGAGALIPHITDERWFALLITVLGALLAGFGILSPNPKKPTGETHNSPTLAKLRGKTSSPAHMVALALGACVVEAATMLPYLAALGIIGDLDAPAAARAALIVLYCLVMILPALLLTFLAHLTGQRLLSTITGWIPRLEYEAKVTLLWVMAIVGIYLVMNYGTAATA